MSKEFKVGLIALVSGVLLYYGFNFLKGVDFFSPTNKYYVIYENVDGLNKSNPVIINGLAVGRVSQIKLMQNGKNAILVQVDIDEDIVLGRGTQAILSNTDFLGSKGIVLNLAPLDHKLVPGDTLISVVDKGFNEIIESATPVANNLNTTISSVNEILIGLEGSGKAIKEALDKINITLDKVNGTIDDNRSDLNETILAVKMLAMASKQQVEVIGRTAASADSLVNDLRGVDVVETNQKLQETLEATISLLEEISTSEGTLGRLMNDDSLYTNINQTMVDLDKLLIHMDQYPKHFFAPLGKSHKKVMKDLDREN